MSSKSMKKAGLLLDTSIQVHRVAGSQKNKRKITDELDDKFIFTTSFVFREFVRLVIAHLEYLHKCLRHINDNDDVNAALANLKSYLDSDRNTYSAASVQRIKLLIAEIMDLYAGRPLSRKRLMVYLERNAKQWVQDFFEVSFPNGNDLKISCLTALDNPGEFDQMKQCDPFPPRPTFPARASRFLSEHKDKVRLIERAMLAQKKAGRKGKKEIEVIIEVLNSLKDDSGEYDFINKLAPSTRGSWRLGLLLVALESHPKLHIYTTKAAFDTFCAALGKVRYKGFSPR